MGQTLFSSFSMQEIITPICNLCLITQTKKNDQYPYFLAGTIWTRCSNRIKTSKWILVNSHEHQEQPVCSSFHSKGEGLECGMEHKVAPPCRGQQRRPGKVTAFTGTSQGGAEVQGKSRSKIKADSAWSGVVQEKLHRPNSWTSAGPPLHLVSSADSGYHRIASLLENRSSWRWQSSHCCPWTGPGLLRKPLFQVCVLGTLT